MSQSEVRAVLDVGSNSVLLLVASRTQSGWAPLTEWTSVTGLGRGTKETGLLSCDGMGETLAALKEGYRLAQKAGATRICAAVTMAARIATNTPEFLAKGEAQQTPLRVLSGEDEAKLGFLSVADDPLMSEADRITIIDPGGHSTELVTADRTADGWRTLFRRSFAIGALGLRDSIWTDESPSLSARLKACQWADDTIGLRYLPHSCGQVVTLGATGTNLIAIREAMTQWDPHKVHGQWLDFEEVGRAVGWMCDMDDAGRAAIVGIEPGREKTLHAGALILERFMQAVGSLGTKVSVKGWRHALLERMDTWPLD